MVAFDRSNRVSMGSAFIGIVLAALVEDGFLFFFVGLRLVALPSGRLSGVDGILSREE
jgi:hypothetical protein